MVGERIALERRLKAVDDRWIATALAGCLAAVGLSGCCACGRTGNSGPGCASGQTAAGQPVPETPEYPRFHPVPTRPVFLPDGIEPVSAQQVQFQPRSAPQVQLRPTDAPALSSVPSDGWHARSQDNADSEP